MTLIEGIHVTTLENEENGPFIYVSVGQAGVWAVNSKNVLFYRRGTYGNNAAIGTHWERKADNVKQVDVGFDNVFYVSDNDNELLEIAGVSKANPLGNAVKKMKQHAKCVALSTRKDAVYSVIINKKNNTLRYNPKKILFKWKSLNFTAQSITNGPAGIWATNPKLAYRKGTLGNRNTKGLGWVEVDPGPFQHVTSGSGVVLAVRTNGTLVQRTSVTCSNPMGNGWTDLQLNVSRVDSYGAVAWAVNASGYLLFIEL